MSSGFPQGLYHLKASCRLNSRLGRSVGRPRKRRLRWSEWLLGPSEAVTGPTARILNGLFQFRECLVYSSMASVSSLVAWQMVEAEL